MQESCQTKKRRYTPILIRKNAAKTPNEPKIKKQEVNINEWPVFGITAKACGAIQKAVIYKGCTIDTVMKITIAEENIPLFTPTIENRLLAIFRKLYNDIILIEFVTLEAIEKRRLYIEKVKAKNALKRELELRKAIELQHLILTKNEQSDTLIES